MDELILKITNYQIQNEKEWSELTNLTTDERASKMAGLIGAMTSQLEIIKIGIKYR